MTLDDIRQDIEAAIEESPGPLTCRQEAGHGPEWFLRYADSRGKWSPLMSGPAPVYFAKWLENAGAREGRLARALQAVLDALDEEQKIHAPQKGERMHGDYFADKAEGARSAVSSIRDAIARNLEKP